MKKPKIYTLEEKLKKKVVRVTSMNSGSITIESDKIDSVGEVYDTVKEVFTKKSILQQIDISLNNIAKLKELIEANELNIKDYEFSLKLFEKEKEEEKKK